MVSSGHLNPGEKGKISTKIDIKDRIGYISKNVQVYSNDPKRTVITLFLKALIK